MQTSRFHFSISFFAVSVAVMFTLTSCGDIHQDLNLNANGSGTLETSFDLGELMTMMEGLEGMNVPDVTVSTDDTEDKNLSDPAPEPPKDPMEELMDRITDPAYAQDFDTLISILSIMPDSVRDKQTRMDLVDRIRLHITSPAKSSNLVMGILMDFDHPAQLKEMVAYLESLDEGSTSGMMSNAGPGGLQKENFMVFDADMKAGWIRFDTVDYSGFSSEMGMGTDSLATSEDMGMVEMMFGQSKIKSVIHVPGEVISCTNPEAILTKDNRVILEYNFMDIIRSGKIPGYTIHFTPKK